MGKNIEVPKRSQLGYPGGSGWCSPTALSMILAYWSHRLHRAELDAPVPEIARAVYDRAYGGTGNWAFNMANAGSFPKMLGYTTMFDSLRQVEDCITAGIPVELSVSFDLLNGKENDQNNDHLIVVVGFTEQGDVVVNDFRCPAHEPWWNWTFCWRLRFRNSGRQSDFHRSQHRPWSLHHGWNRALTWIWVGRSRAIH